MKKAKIIITAAIMAALVTATACGGKDQASTPTVVKQVNSTSTEKATDKQEVTEVSVENTASSNEEVLVAEAVTDENQGNSDSVEEINNTVPAAAEDINAAWTDTTPAEQPEENINSGWEDAAPVEQPAEAPVEEAKTAQIFCRCVKYLRFGGVNEYERQRSAQKNKHQSRHNSVGNSGSHSLKNALF